jgi:protein tyrosine/serine phosphatase
MIVPIKIGAGIYRGPSPQSKSDFQDLENLGIKYMLNLQSGEPLLKDGSPLIESLTGDLFGIRIYSHPLGEILPPNQEELEDAFNFIVNHGPVYIHCKTGVDRTGMVCAYYKMTFFNWSKKQAVNEMKALGMHFWYSWWSWFL